MKPVHFATRILALFLSLAFAVPNSAFALRVENGGLEEKSRTTLEVEKLLHGGPSQLSNLVRTPAAGLEEGMQKLGQLRSSVADLPTYSVSTAWLWGTLDFLLRSDPALGVVGQASQEYTGTRDWLHGENPDL